METTITLAEVKAKLNARGYDGLYLPGECACEINDLAHCGSCEREDDEDYINGCEAGYKHTDPTRPDFWIISIHNDPPSQKLFDKLHAYSG